MDRRSFLKSTSIAAGAAGIVAAPGVDAALANPAILRSAEPLTIAVDWPQATPVLGELAGRLARRLEQLSDGRLLIEMAPEAAVSGDFRLGVVGGSGVGGLPLTFATAIPGGLQDEAHADWLRFGGGSELLDEAAAAHGLKLFHAGSLCSQPGLWLKRSVKLTPQMRGLSVAAFGLGADVATELGCLATPIASPWSTELSGREFDAIDAVDPLIDLMAGRPGRHETLWSPGLNSSGFHLTLSIDRGLWEAMERSAQAMFEAAMSFEADWVTAALRVQRHPAMYAARADRRLNEANADGREGVKLRDITQAVVRDAVAADPLAREIADSYFGFRQMPHPRFGTVQAMS